MKKVAIFSVPRSGSTWLGSIFDSHPNVAFRFQPLFSYSHKSQLSDQSAKAEIKQFFTDILKTDDPFVLQHEAKKTGLVPTFNKKEITHIVFKEVRYLNIIQNLLEKDEDIKIIGIVRNPLAVINSWLLAPKEFRADLGWMELEEWRLAEKKNLNKPEEYNGYEKWKEAILLFEKLIRDFSERFFLLRYDELLFNTIPTVDRLFKFVELEPCDQTLSFLEKRVETGNNDAYSVQKKKIADDQWKLSLHPKIKEEILQDLTLSSLERYITND